MKGVRTGVCIALVGILAGGGGAYAATQITSAEIKDGTIQAKDIKKGTITASNLAAAARNGMTGAAGPSGRCRTRRRGRTRGRNRSCRPNWRDGCRWARRPEGRHGREGRLGGAGGQG